MTLGLIVIDMDDTVYLERDYVRSGFLAVDQYVRDHGAPPGFFEFAWRMFCDGATGDIFDRAIEAMSLPDVVAVGNLVDCYRQHVPDIMMTDDSTGFLKSIDGRVPWRSSRTARPSANGTRSPPSGSTPIWTRSS